VTVLQRSDCRNPTITNYQKEFCDGDANARRRRACAPMLSLPQCAQVLKMQGRAGVRECSRANLSGNRAVRERDCRRAISPAHMISD
jgi:hypothetical protein